MKNIFHILLGILLTTALAASAARGQGEDLKEQLDKYESILKGKGGEPDAIALIDSFTSRFKANSARIEGIKDDLELKQGDTPKLTEDLKTLEKEQEQVAEAVYKCFVHGKRKEINQPNLDMWKAGAFALGQMGDRGAARLWKIFEDKKFKKETEFLGTVLEQIGSTDNWASAEMLADLLDHHEYHYIAKAADALALFNDAPGPVRRDVVERMVKLYAQYSEDAESDQQDQEKQEKFRKTSGSMAKALEALTGTQQRTPTDWNTWFNKHKTDKAVWGE